MHLGVSVAQDLHRHRKIRRDAPPRRHVAALHESSREKIVISVNSRATRSTNKSCDKQGKSGDINGYVVCCWRISLIDDVFSCSARLC